MKVTILHAGYCICPEHLAIRGGRWRGIRFPAMFALLEHAQYGPMLYDTGYSFRFFEETRTIPNRLYRWVTPVNLKEAHLAVHQLSSFNIKPSDIRRVFISHFHADHIAALDDFRRASFVFLPQAYEAVRFRHGLGAISRGFLPNLIPTDFYSRATPVDLSQGLALPPEFAPFRTGYDLLGDRSLIAIELPGHAHGQMGIVAQDDERGTFFFVADAAWQFEAIRGNINPSNLSSLIFDNPKAYRETLESLHNLWRQRPDMHVVPSHCTKTLERYMP